ncbi:MAG: hypothetical protein ACPLXC_01365 [Candidatus Pacearchaeota archaeon]
MSKTKTSAQYKKEFLEAFIRRLILLKEKSKKTEEGKHLEKEREKFEEVFRKERAKERIAKIAAIEKKLRPSIMKTAEQEEMKARLKALSIEKEAVEKLEAEARGVAKEAEKIARAPIPKPTPEATLAPPTLAPVTPEIPMPPMYRHGTLPVPMPPKKIAPEVTLQIATTIDLGKLNPLIQDASVSLVQCDGADIPIKIVKQGKLSETIISMSENEINNIIKKFADRANQVITEPIFKTQVGNLALTAIISSFTGSRFVISKI